MLVILLQNPILELASQDRTLDQQCLVKTSTEQNLKWVFSQVVYCGRLAAISKGSRTARSEKVKYGFVAIEALADSTRNSGAKRNPLSCPKFRHRGALRWMVSGCKPPLEMGHNLDISAPLHSDQEIPGGLRCPVSKHSALWHLGDWVSQCWWAILVAGIIISCTSQIGKVVSKTDMGGRCNLVLDICTVYLKV